jgi:hypothetical protein
MAALGTTLERGTIVQVLEVVPNMQHPGGGHFDIRFINELGEERKQRFWRGGKAFTEAENEALVNWSSGGGRRGGRVRRGGSISGELTMNVVAGIAAAYLSDAAYNAYVDEGWEAGMALSKRVGFGRALQLYGMLGELPPGETFTFQHGGTTYHVMMAQDKSGQWYFTVWHQESHWSWMSWADIPEMVWDIQPGQVPAFHNPLSRWPQVLSYSRLLREPEVA